MSTETAARIGLVLIVVGILIQQFVAMEVRPRRARKAARDAEDTARVVAAFEQLKALPETTAFDPPEDLPRARLHIVKTTPDDLAWARLLRAVDEVPEQRKPGAWS